MKRFLILITFLNSVLLVFSETLEIKLLNTPSIIIGGKKLKIGDKFDAGAKISWSSDKQAMKVLSQDNKLFLLTQKEFAKRNISNFVSYKKSTFVRETPPMTLEDHKEIFEKEMFLLDTLFIEVGWKVNDNSYFVIEYEREGQKNNFILPYDNGSLVINRDLFADLEEEETELQLSVKYVEKEYNDSTLITDKMVLYIKPLFVD